MSTKVWPNFRKKTKLNISATSFWPLEFSPLISFISLITVDIRLAQGKFINSFPSFALISRAITEGIFYSKPVWRC